MSGLGYDARIERGVASSRLTCLHPASAPFCVGGTLQLLKGALAPRAPSQVSGLYVFESTALCRHRMQARDWPPNNHLPMLYTS